MNAWHPMPPPLTADQKLQVEENMALAYAAARKVWGDSLATNHTTLQDLESASMVGLCHAAQYFNPDRGVKFSSYAWRCCILEILIERDERRLIRVPHWRGNRDKVKAQASRHIDQMNFEIDEPLWHDGIDFDRDDSVGKVRAALVHLLPADRALIERHLGGESFRSIGNSLGCSNQNISNRYRRICQILYRNRVEWGLSC